MVAAEVALLFQHRLPQLCSKLLILPGDAPALSAEGCQRSIVFQRVPVSPHSIQCSSPPPAPARAQVGLSEGTRRIWNARYLLSAPIPEA